mmetsp:Transcript_9974/g.13438  ORF Transcript_9974/g.13438 Transcript_9974/m.13438 type:complete len:181 (+) Transcript_9974:64-606(+)
MPSTKQKQNVSRRTNPCDGVWKSRRERSTKPVALSYLEFTLGEEDENDLSLDFSCLSVEKTSLRPLLDLPEPLSPLIEDEDEDEKRENYLSSSNPLPLSEPLFTIPESSSSSSSTSSLSSSLSSPQTQTKSVQSILSILNSDPRVLAIRSPARILAMKRYTQLVTQKARRRPRDRFFFGK